MKVSIKSFHVTNLNATPVTGRITQTLSNLYHKKWGITTILLLLSTAPVWSVALGVVYVFALLVDRVVLAFNPAVTLPSVLEKESIQSPKAEDKQLTEVERDRLLLLREHLPEVIVEGKFQNSHYESISREIVRLVKETIFTIEEGSTAKKAKQVLVRVAAAPLIIGAFALGGLAAPVIALIDKVRFAYFMKAPGRGRVPHGIENLRNKRDVDFNFRGSVFNQVMGDVKSSMQELLVDLSHVDNRIKKTLIPNALLIREALFFLSTASWNQLDLMKMEFSHIEQLQEALNTFEDIALLIDTHVEGDLLANSAGVLSTGWSVIADHLQTYFGKYHSKYVYSAKKREHFIKIFQKFQQPTNDRVRRVILPKVQAIRDEGFIPTRLDILNVFQSELTGKGERFAFKEQGVKLFANLTEAESLLDTAHVEGTPQARAKAQEVVQAATKELIEWMGKYDLFIEEHTLGGSEKTRSQAVQVAKEFRQRSSGKREVQLVCSLFEKCMAMASLSTSVDEVCLPEQKQTLCALSLAFGALLNRLSKFTGDVPYQVDMETIQNGLLAKVISNEEVGAVKDFFETLSLKEPEAQYKEAGQFFLSYFRKIWLAGKSDDAIKNLSPKLQRQAILHQEHIEGKKLLEAAQEEKPMKPLEKRLLAERLHLEQRSKALEDQVKQLNVRLAREEKQFVDLIASRTITVSTPPQISLEEEDIVKVNVEEKGTPPRAVSAEEDLVAQHKTLVSVEKTKAGVADSENLSNSGSQGKSLLEQSKLEEQAYLQRQFQTSGFSTDMSLYQHLLEKMGEHNKGKGGLSPEIVRLERAKAENEGE